MEQFRFRRTGFLATWDKTSRRLVIGGFFILILHWLFILGFIFPRLGTLRFLRLHSMAMIGVNWVDVWWKIFLFPVVGTVAFFINFLFSSFFIKRTRLLSGIILSANLVLQILFAVGGIFVISLNF